MLYQASYVDPVGARLCLVLVEDLLPSDSRASLRNSTEPTFMLPLHINTLPVIITF